MSNTFNVTVEGEEELSVSVSAIGPITAAVTEIPEVSKVFIGELGPQGPSGAAQTPYAIIDDDAVIPAGQFFTIANPPHDCMVELPLIEDTGPEGSSVPYEVKNISQFNVMVVPADGSSDEIEYDTQAIIYPAPAGRPGTNLRLRTSSEGWLLT